MGKTTAETRRTASPDAVFPKRKDAAGNRLCRRCWRVLTGRRTSWCSEKCRNLALAVCYPSFARYMVECRDAGVCSMCGLDTQDIQDQLESLRRLAGGIAQRPGGDPLTYLAVAKGWTKGTGGYKEAHGFETNAARAILTAAWKMLDRHRFNVGRSLWEADHEKPVVEGGGLCELDGYRTLCVPCHKSASAFLAKRRAAARRKHFAKVSRTESKKGP